MRGDRTLKFLLVLIAAGLWALTLTQAGMPVAGAEESAHLSASPPAALSSSQAGAPGSKQIDKTTSGPKAPTSTYPLRWRVAWATIETGTTDTYCGTAVIVTNTTTASIDVDVEFMKDDGSSAGRALHTLGAYENYTAITVGSSLTINVGPYWWDDQVASPDFSGYALVGANDPRIMVSAFQFCRSSTGYSGAIVRSHTNIPAFPVGATAEFFQAVMPMAGPPPAAIVEEPR
jgi:hypothetical protein